MHKLYTEQLQKAVRPDGTVDIEVLGSLVRAAYEEFDRDRRRNDRAITLMIGEVEALNRGLERLVNQRTEELQRREAELQEQNVRFEAAINNMSQGLVMFDAGANLVVCNRRYREVYGLSPEQTQIGTALSTLLRCRARMGTFSGDPDHYVAYLLDSLAQGQNVTRVTDLPDGRTVTVVNHPMPDGGWVATHEDITERRRAEQRIAHMARHDALTDLPNRTLLRERLGVALSNLHRGRMLAVLYLDLDHFKTVNDTLGHPVGDELLKGMAERLQQCVADWDTVARIGGDEFAIIQTDIESPSEAAMLARLICEIIKAPYDLHGHVVVAETSIGIAIAPNDGTEADELLKNADLALYGAKAEGRGTYCFFESEMDARVKSRRSLEIDLRRALEQDEFEVHYQPMLDLKTDCISGCEALLRWRRADGKMIPPAEFIPVAEEIGLIAPLGEWVLRQACTAAATWPDHIRVAVNLSPIQVNSKNLLSTVISALAASHLPARRLELEITEAVLMQNSDSTIAMLHRLRELGVRISMDDFGTGYSSLSYLRSFPFDRIKIDRCFISGLPEADDSIAIIRAVTMLAASLRMTTTAEGVETQRQRELVGALGCTELQGFAFSKPLPAAELLQFIRPVLRKAQTA